MLIDSRRSCVRCALVLVAALSAWLPCPSSHAEIPPSEASPADTERVFVSGVQDSFERVRAAIEKAKLESGRDYRVIVVGDAGGDRDASTRLLESLVERWQQESAEGRQRTGRPAAFDPARDVTIVLDIKDRQIAMKAPWGLEVSSGLNPRTIKEELIDKVFVPRAKDGQYDEGLADLVDATERWVKRKAESKLAKVEAARVFRTRTLPLGLATLAGLGAVTTFFVQRARHERRLAEAQRKLAAFKSEVVALSDLLDSQQERHRMLPHSDPDFKTPMEGLTRSAYDNVQSALRRYRERWLGLMDVWEKAEERIGKETFLGTAEAEEAIRLLDSAEARPPLADVAAECSAPLDALEQSHEKARALAATLDTNLATTTQRLEALAKRSRSSAAFQGPMAEVARGAGLARQGLEADPVAARGRLEELTTRLDRSITGIDELEAVDDRRIKAVAQADEIAQKVRAKRADGWLLAEPGANPDELLAASQHDCAIAAQLLDADETAGARSHVERAEKANAEAVALLESIAAAKTKVDELLPACVARLEALAARRGQAVRAVEQISGAYADSSWADVVDNVAKADEGLARVRTLLAETQVAADHSRQHYFRAVALVEEAVRQEDWIEGLYAAITDRRAELDELRASLPRRRDAVRDRVSNLLQGLERQRTDRVRANERVREAGRLLEAAEEGFQVQRPDLRRVGQVLEAADTAAARGEELAAEDDRLARQAFDDLEETDGLIRRVAAWYGEGVSPDVRPAATSLETAKSLLSRQRYEDSLKASAEANRLARESYAEATTEAERRRRRRLAQIQQRQLEDSFARTSRGFGPWVIQLPGGVFSGPDPWRTMHGPTSSQGSSRSVDSNWSSNTAQSGW
jgi:chromosome segregation ATPase